MPEVDNNRPADYDIVIIGGGLVGASLAVALADTSYRIAVIEAFEFDTAAQPAYDERTIALTYSAKHIFDQLGIWNETVESEACALKSIHISNQGHFGKTRLDHNDAGTEALGYVIPTRSLGRALINKIASTANVDFLCPFEAEEINCGENFASIKYKKPGARKLNSLSAKLMVIADGGRSHLLKSLGFTHQNKTYPQSALLSIVKTSIPHQHKAYERFVANGPLALLPMNDQRFAVVWTLSPEQLKSTASMSDSDYLAQLQSTFGTRAGLFSSPSPRKAYPLNKSYLEKPYSHRVLAMGNAAHTVHPVAGQGFNLGLRDVAALAEQLLLEPDADIGSLDFLKTYSSSRADDTQGVARFTDGLLSIFNHSSPLVQLGRNVGLAAVENLPFVKRALLKRTMGLGRNQPRLARGLKLRQRP